ncbi:oxygenase MpaB family protein [Nocardia crassostreae]|uniref:oxygenase MpaB family protein n=1 Tax=Nocardia crassostreae TaxID=53428 RepID=UPI0014716D42|nr:oxygenase MpaB family protein [Nocardia crassostreae]
MPAGQSTTADGQPDYGYFGPSSVVWQVLLGPQLVPLWEAVTGVLEAPHPSVQSVEVDHDPVVLAARQKTGGPGLLLERARRTARPVIQIVAGDTATADWAARRLRAIHARMTGHVVDSGEPYDAQSPAMVIFAHVTIWHAALRIYETHTFRGGRRRRLSATERDRYWAELVTFGELMGAPREMVPDSVAAVARYYDSIRDEYRFTPEIFRAAMDLLQAVLRPTSWQEARLMPWAVVVAAGAVPTTPAALPRPLRRVYRIPRAADPVIDAIGSAGSLALAALSIRSIGDRYTRQFIDDETLGLIRNMRTLVADTATAESA